jgi:1,4-alpha-glucan branching enzyme
MTPTISQSQIEALVAGEHSDPFAVLGPHLVSVQSAPAVAIRVFLPRVRQVTVVPADRPDQARPMEMVHPAGFFEAVFPRDRALFPYRLRVRDDEGQNDEIDDPYRFPPTLTDYDLHLMSEGTHLTNYERLGAHLTKLDGTPGVTFAVWAPNAGRVSVVGDFNRWDGRCHPMRNHPGSGIWEIFIPGLDAGSLYKFEIRGRVAGDVMVKADPFAFALELAPRTASIVADLDAYRWGDHAWMEARTRCNPLERPLSIYEVHLGSWMRVPEDANRFLSYRELAHRLGDYAAEMGYTHVELLPVMEHPFYGSWGYQTTGYFAPSRRYGTPADFMYFIDYLHQRGIGVILDWVPSHFPRDPHGLACFDGTHLYEHQDPQKGEHRDWGTLIFNYGRREVSNFLIGNALFWLERYHVDGLRVDAVASMLYLDYSRRPGEWIPNVRGGNENLEAIDFLKRLNELVYDRHPGVVTIAEESTAWPGVSRPTYVGGLGFGLKWNMGWMHDMLAYMGLDPVHRSYHHNSVTFSLLYAFSENFILPLSHDEVVHGKRSLLDRMPGDVWQRFANLRCLYGYMYGHPGKKLLFMGGEFGQWREWDHERSLDWHLLRDGRLHAGLQRLVADLNRLYRSQPALFERDFDHAGFEWLDCHDWQQSIVSFVRRAKDPEDLVVVVANFTPVPRHGYRIGVPCGGFYRELLNTDAAIYGGSNVGNHGGVTAVPRTERGPGFSLELTLPPLAAIVLKPTYRGGQS